ncbi:hypothetical protein LTR12_001153 [Friedmanniomyces endolithicus]|nr:hypothetical protein LTR74_014388 [Friedmanniomyces endolithicus]KAK1824315.1 hypothetical protein LTR12_001153 [Friedmanniomyces endolithicus]
MIERVPKHVARAPSSARGLLELARQRDAAAEEGDKAGPPDEEREGEDQAEDQGERALADLRERYRAARSAIMSCGMEQHKAVLELTEEVKGGLYGIFSNGDSDESGRRQLAAAIMELEQFVQEAAA